MQQWNDLEVVDLPKCGRCAFRGRRPENVRFFKTIYEYFIAISIDGVCTLAKHEHVRRPVYAGGGDMYELVSLIAPHTFLSLGATKRIFL